MDEETRQALLLFNRRAEAAEAATAYSKRLDQAEKAKDEAAAALQKTQDEGGGSEAVSAAEMEWRTALSRWQKLRDGETPDETPKEE